MNHGDILTNLLSLIVLLVLLDVLEAAYYQARALFAEQPQVRNALVCLAAICSPPLAILTIYLAVPHGP